MLINVLLLILVLYVKRFCYDMNVGGMVKVMKQVWFGPELEISDNVSQHMLYDNSSLWDELWLGTVAVSLSHTASWHMFQIKVKSRQVQGPLHLSSI